MLRNKELSDECFFFLVGICCHSLFDFHYHCKSENCRMDDVANANKKKKKKKKKKICNDICLFII